MSEFDIVRQRLHQHQLTQTTCKTPADVVAWLGAMQSQEYLSALWGVGMRLPAATESQIEAAYNSGAILRTHVLRPTWHFVAPADIRWMLQLTAARVHALNAYMYRKCELDETTLLRSMTIITQVLQGNKHLTREELAAALEKHGIPEVARFRLAYIMMYAELEGLICSGIRRGKQFTYTLLEERVAPAPALTRDEALAELTKRYFISHGPALLEDFAWWSGLTKADVRHGIEMQKAALQCIEHNGKTYWFVPVDAATTSPAFLMSIFDEYLIAYSDYSPVSGAVPFEPVLEGYNSLVVVDGRVVGSWKRTLKKKHVVVEMQPFDTQFTPAETRVIEAAAQRFGAFVEREVVLDIG